jgi:gluconolactonase
VAPGGGIYFSDFAGMGAAVLPGETMQLYYIPPGSKNGSDIRRATQDMSAPNGLIGTADGKLLYAVDQGGVFTYNIGKDGALSGRKLFVGDRADGMALDERGNLYLAAAGVVVYSAKGEKLETITVPEQVSNVKFVGKNRDTLFITARASVYTLKMQVKGAPTALDMALTSK